MQQIIASPSLVQRASRMRRFTFVALGICLAALLAALAAVLVNTTVSAAVAPFAPSAEDGLIPEGAVVTFADDDVTAIARLHPDLLAAMRRAEADAASDGLAFQVTSGWRSARYQQWIFEEAVEQHGSEAVARELVATPDRSRHVTGDAVDIGPIDAQFWLIDNGSRYGICQTYANERWHFELATEPGGVCPEMRADASS
jgi:hypothetical protein